jgi:hypothetical protein
MGNTEQIYTECITALDRETIIGCAERGNETPFGYLLTYLKDMYFIPKYYGWGIAERILKHFDIEM